MPKNIENFKNELEGFLNSFGIQKIVLLNLDGSEVIDPSEAEQFKFHFKNNSQDLGTVTITVYNGNVTVYHNQGVADNVSVGNTGWTTFLKKLKDWSLRNGQMSFKVDNIDRLGFQMKKRKAQHLRDSINEGYYGTKTTSYNDDIPKSIKMIIKHNKALDENDKRYRYVDRIFLETSEGERLLLNTKRPSLGRVYARHLAEGGQHNDERWKHISEMISDLDKLNKFVRATKNKQFNENTQNVVEQVQQNYFNLKENLKKLQTHRGYNSYFESWKPALIENTSDVNYETYFKVEQLDKRIEDALPVIQKMNIKINEISEANEFENWANNIIETIDSIESTKIDNLVELLKSNEELSVGADAMNIKGQLEDIIDDDAHREMLFKELEYSAKIDADNDAKPIIVSWLQKHKHEPFYGDVLEKYQSNEMPSNDKQDSIKEPIANTNKNKEVQGKSNDNNKDKLKSLMPEPMKENQELINLKKLIGIVK